MEWWRKYGYLAGKEIGNGEWIVVMPMIFTFRLARCTPDSVSVFYCYPREDLALTLVAYEQWSGDGDPLDGWVRTIPSHRTRPDGDPAKEYINE